MTLVRMTCAAMLDRAAWFELDFAERGYDNVLRRQALRAVLGVTAFPVLGWGSAAAVALVSYPLWVTLEDLTGVLDPPWSRVLVAGGLATIAVAVMYARRLRRLWALDRLPTDAATLRRRQGSMEVLVAALSRCTPHASSESEATWDCTVDHMAWSWTLTWTHQAGHTMRLRADGAPSHRSLECTAEGAEASHRSAWTYSLHERVWRSASERTTDDVTRAMVDDLGRWLNGFAARGAVEVSSSADALPPEPPPDGNLTLTLTPPAVEVATPDAALGTRAFFRRFAARVIELLVMGVWAFAASVTFAYYAANGTEHAVGFAALGAVLTLVWSRAGVLPYTGAAFASRARMRPLPPPPEAPAPVSLERAGDVVTLGDASIDLAQPFHAHLTRDPERPHLGITLTQGTTRLRLCTAASPSPAFSALPELDVEGAWITPAQLTDRLWPELVAYGAAHGLRLPGLTQTGDAT